tara:strand:+ start:894 stop:1190 length:297 start_codon:yes stop_codon:yes gene_type:complete
MYSQRVSKPLERRRAKDMSYMFGPHHPSGKTIYFGGDGRESSVDSLQIPVSTGDPPTWLVADWILAQNRGEPLTENAQRYCSSITNPALCWLNEFLHS